MKKITTLAIMFCLVFTGVFQQKSFASNYQHETDVDELIEIAKEYLGIPYEWGGTTPEGFDCSGYLQYIHDKIGIELPRVAKDQAKAGMPVSRSDLKAGDIIYFERTGHRENVKITHSGMYLGNDEFIHSSLTDGVNIANLPDSSYWNSRYLGATRVIIDNADVSQLAVNVSKELYSEGFMENADERTIILLPSNTAQYAASYHTFSEKYNSAPILFTERDFVSEEVMEEISRLGADHVVLLGEHDALS